MLDLSAAQTVVLVTGIVCMVCLYVMYLDMRDSEGDDV